MDPEPEKPSTPFIPPPTLAKPTAGPASPLDAIRAAAAPPVAVHIKADSTDAEETADGLASFNSRAVALIIDSVLMTAVAFGINLVLPAVLSPLGWLASLGYLLTKDSLPFLGGQSVGKKAMKIQAVTLDGQSLAGNWQAGAIRNVALIFPFILVEIYMLLSREDKPDHGKRLGDEYAKTKVIVIKPPVVEEA